MKLWWLFDNCILGNKLKWNMILNASIFIPEMTIYVLDSVCEIEYLEYRNESYILRSWSTHTKM